MTNGQASPHGGQRELPSLFSLPLLGDTLSFAKDPGSLLEKRARTLGPVFKISVFNHPTACFVGPEAFALLLDDQNVERANANPPHVQAMFNPRAVPFLDGAVHRRRKGLLMHAFQDPALEGYLPLIEGVLRRYARRWAERGTFRWVPELNALGFTIAGSLFVGADPAKDDPAIEQAFGRVADGILSIPIKLPFTRYGKGLKARDFLLGIIDEALDRAEQNPGGTNVLARLREARTGDERLARDELRIETFHFFGAYAAVIGGLSFVASALAQFPEVQARAREEVLREVGQGALTVAGLKRLEYLGRVTREARRMTPVLPMTFFGTVKRELVHDGVRIPAGHRALGCIGSTLLDPDVFPEPHRFDPDRWLQPSERQRNAWVPHGGGAHAEGHRCAGEALANLMLKSFAVHMLRDFRFKATPGQDLSPTKDKLFATPTGGLEVQLQRLSQAAAA